MPSLNKMTICYLTKLHSATLKEYHKLEMCKLYMAGCQHFANILDNMYRQ